MSGLLDHGSTFSVYGVFVNIGVKHTVADLFLTVQEQGFCHLTADLFPFNVRTFCLIHQSFQNHCIVRNHIQAVLILGQFFINIFYVLRGHLQVGIGKLGLDHVLQLVEQKTCDGQGGDQTDQKSKDNKLRENAVRVNTFPFHNITSRTSGSAL